MITAAIVTREEFVAWASGRALDQSIVLDPAQIKSKLRKGLCAIIWNGEGLFRRNENPIVVVPKSELADFFAFVTTYITEFSPFSAFYRVLSLEEFDRQADLPANAKLPPKLASKLIGISIAESFIRANGRVSTLDEMPLTAIGATLSTVLAAGVFNRSTSKTLNEVARRWTAASRILGDVDGSRLVPSALDIFQAVAFAVGNYEPREHEVRMPTLPRVLLNVALHGVISADDWRALASNRPEVSNVYSAMRGPREDRIKTFLSAIAALRESGGDKGSQVECLAGCLLALVGDGSFQYLQLSREFNPDLPGATLWFGLWASLFKSSDVLTIGNCLGRRAARDFLPRREMFDEPTDDISFDELEVVGAPSLRNIRVGQQGVLSVELALGVSAKFRIGKSLQASQEESLLQPAAIADEMAELRFLLDRIDNVANRLGAGLGLGSNSQDRSSRWKRKSR